METAATLSAFKQACNDLVGRSHACIDQWQREDSVDVDEEMDSGADEDEDDEDEDDDDEDSDSEHATFSPKNNEEVKQGSS